jgi:hypothetical protein
MLISLWYVGRRDWRYQRGNQKPYIEEEQTTQRPKEKVQKDKQRSAKHTYKTKDRVTRKLVHDITEILLKVALNTLTPWSYVLTGTNPWLGNKMNLLLFFHH